LGGQGASTADVQHHYDVGNDFYQLWLDSEMIYSSALYADDGCDDLGTAQIRKLDYYIDNVRAAGAARVLDIGCGWGGLLRRLVEQRGAASAIGLTLSAAQIDSTRSWADDRYEFRLEHWEEHRADGPYDAIISLGAMEHFADLEMSPAEKTQRYRQFFRSCHEWLAGSGARLGVQSIVRGSNTDVPWSVARDMIFINRRIFRGSAVPRVPEVLDAIDGLFQLVSVRNDASHYARTCSEWLERLRREEDRAVELVGADIYADYVRYLQASALVFAKGHAGLARMIFERV
jgi:cyclopropane-fatty-acyl-phospholipid synthase